VCGLDAAGKATFCSEALMPMTGYQTDELLGKTLDQLLYHSRHPCACITDQTSKCGYDRYCGYDSPASGALSPFSNSGQQLKQTGNGKVHPPPSPKVKARVTSCMAKPHAGQSDFV
jgi:hypothetical protein